MYAMDEIQWEKWPKMIRMLMPHYSTMVDLLGPRIFEALFRYRKIYTGFLYTILESRLRYLCSSNYTMTIPDGEACSYSGWIERIDRTVDFLKGAGPLPQDSDNSNRNECVRHHRREVQLQKLLEMVIELLYAAFVVLFGAVLGALLKTTLVSLTSFIIWIASRSYTSHTTFGYVAPHIEELYCTKWLSTTFSPR